MNTAWLTKERKIILASTVFIGIVLVLVSHIGNSVHPLSIKRFPTKVFSSSVLWDLDVAATNEARTLGLGERDSYPVNRAMLFLFPHPDQYGFWMKGMRFPIDIIFLLQGEVIFIERAFQPSDSRIVAPPVPADQVLEVNAGEVSQLSPGDQLWYWRPLY